MADSSPWSHRMRGAIFSKKEILHRQRICIYCQCCKANIIIAIFHIMKHVERGEATCPRSHSSVELSLNCYSHLFLYVKLCTERFYGHSLYHYLHYNLGKSFLMHYHVSDYLYLTMQIYFQESFDI